MQPLLIPAKLFCRAIVAGVFVLIFSALAVAQVYQIRPDGSLLYSPRYANPNFQQGTVAPQIYPGQIINGERVVGPSVPAPPLSRGEAVNPPQPPASNSDRKNQKPLPDNQQSKQSQRPDPPPRTNLPIPPGPKLKSEPGRASEPAVTDAVSNETPENLESSITKEEKNDLAEQENSKENQSSKVEIEAEEISQQQEIPVVEPPSLDLPAEEPSSQEELMEEPPSRTLSIDQFSSEGDPSDELPTLEPPTSETTGDELTLAPPELELDEDILAEIKQIRDQLGGGISKTLEGVDQMPSFGSIEITPSPESAGTDMKKSPEELFNEELRSVMSEQDSNSDLFIGSPQTPQSPPTASSQIQPPYAADRTEELRACARELELLAGRLEAIEAYENADQVRRQATDLWTTARQR